MRAVELIVDGLNGVGTSLEGKVKASIHKNHVTFRQGDNLISLRKTDTMFIGKVINADAATKKV